MKRIVTLFTVLLGAGAMAQTTVPNASFENFTNEVVYDSLEEWNTSGTQTWLAYGYSNVWYDDADPQDGDLALEMITVFEWDDMAMEDDTIFGYAIKQNASGPGFEGFPYTDTVNQVTFWYKCDVQPGDSAICIVELRKGGAMYAAATYKMGGTVGSWTEVNLPIINGETEEPDSVFIGFASSDPLTPGAPKEDSWLAVDNVSFQHTVGSMTAPSVIPNHSFENWFEEEIGLPDDWFTFDLWTYTMTGGVQYAVEVADPTDGASALEITTHPEHVFLSIPTLVTNGEFEWGSGDFTGGVPFNAQPDSVTYDLKYVPSGMDTCVFWLTAWDDGGIIIDTMDWVDATIATYETRSITLPWTAAPDSMRITLYSGDEAGSVMTIDNIRFGGGDLGNATITLAEGWKVFPNPSNAEVTVSYTSADAILIRNIAGKTIYSENGLNGGSTTINTEDWAEGIYLIQLQKEGKVETKKLVVKH